jgi:hypothetical protein
MLLIANKAAPAHSFDARWNPDAGSRRSEERPMATIVASLQLIAVAVLIFGVAVLSWRAGDRFWSSR